MKPAPTWQRRPRKRQTLPPIPAPPEPVDVPAADTAAAMARRAALVAGAADLAEMAKRLHAAGEMSTEAARSLGAKV